jgi:hypothetical protein
VSVSSSLEGCRGQWPAPFRRYRRPRVREAMRTDEPGLLSGSRAVRHGASPSQIGRMGAMPNHRGGPVGGGPVAENQPSSLCMLRLRWVMFARNQGSHAGARRRPQARARRRSRVQGAGGARRQTSTRSATSARSCAMRRNMLEHNARCEATPRAALRLANGPSTGRRAMDGTSAVVVARRSSRPAHRALPACAPDAPGGGLERARVRP